MSEKSQVLNCNDLTGGWTSAGVAILNTVRFLKEDYDLPQVMGYTGFAFRININAADVDVAGPTAFDWESIFERGLANLGIKATTVRTKDFVAPTPEELKQAIAMVQDSIDQGVPAISWDMHVPEFGNIYGYDDQKQAFMAKDPAGDQPLPYEKLGRGQVNEMFVATVQDSFEIDRKSQLKNALEMAIEHARYREHQHELPPYENGLKGYDAWIEAFEKGQVSEFGNAYNIHVVQDARRVAAKFFDWLKVEWKDDERISNLCYDAQEKYNEVANHLEELIELYPFPQGGEPNKPQNAQITIDKLQLAKEAEFQAVNKLEELLEEVK
ncbi:hypothetical protein E3U55_06275 [Filobacillus milosensis]|uniref:DUF4872 domain-containing protein n=1 Tax=Filobacillus milosensis TaxID=94137 RepID=A0A4Y8IQM5_9BACI|nr:hypothetical protein [Filobacillus milosensis]TFB22840.1 hypothetical protein E3U55_06275 [Filobacillus milosensis]